ncbi:CocE/NonD family hydrolase [Streptomyces sp. NPDC018019]|uniref:CocE/NonD family hydrolase n=1 Tax=Streptomyces sp. NPDC018019 TaxID=3365030 RepID=UPI00378C4B0C
MTESMLRDRTRRGLGRLVDRYLDLPEPVTPDVECVRDLRVPMRDGTVLLADRYRPRGAGPLPVVLLRTPYGKHKPDIRLFAGVLARRGFQVVAQNVRGVFGSGGDFRAFVHEKEDGLDTAAWLRERAWCDGRLATAGASYLGHTEWAIGPYLDPPLEAMCLGITTSGFPAAFYPGGVLALHNMLVWSSATGTQEEAPLGGLLPNPLQTRRVQRAMRTLPVGEADLAAIGRPERFLREVSAHAVPGDDFWAPIDHSAAALRMSTPTSMVTGWWDLFLPWQLRDFAALTAAGHRSRITIGPWAHDRNALKATLTDHVSWLSAQLAGDATQLHQSPVRLYLQRAGRWLDFDRWPPPQSVPTPLRLQPSGGLDWPEPPDGAPDRFTYHGADPTPSTGGPLLLPGEIRQQDNAAVERRPDVLVFTGRPLPRDLDLIGPVSAVVHVRTDSGHGDVFVRLCDVDRAGISRNVTDGILRLRPGSPPADADGVVTARVEMHPTGYRFLRGHSLRVQVAGGAFPRYARHHGTGEPVASAVACRPIRFEVFHEPGRPSAVVLPLMTAPAPPGGSEPA